MKSLHATVLIVGAGVLLAGSLLIGSVGWGAGQAKIASSDKPPENVKVVLTLPTFLRVGQPLEGSLEVLVRTENTRQISINLMQGGTAKLDMVDDKGNAVAFRLQLFGSNGDYAGFRLWPTDLNAERRYWKPGVYHLHATVEVAPTPLEFDRWHGKSVTNKVRLEIGEPDAVRPSLLNDPIRRQRAVDWIKDLDAVQFAKREEAEKALTDCGVPALSLIEGALANASLEAALRLKRIRQTSLSPFTKESFFPLPDMGALLASFDDQTWKALQKHLGSNEWELRVQRARHAPILMLPENELVALLKHADPDMRIQAIRSLPRTKDATTLEKLLACLDDPYKELMGVADPTWLSPVAFEAHDALIWQGQAVVPLLLNLAKKDGGIHKPQVAQMLGAIGPSKPAEQFVSEFLKDKTNWNLVVGGLPFVSWGPGGIPVFLEIANNEKEDSFSRYLALTHVAQHTSADELRPTIRRLLAPTVPKELTSTAIWLILHHELRDMLPEVKPIAFSEKHDENTRNIAIDTVVALVDRTDAEKFLLALIDSPAHFRIRMRAMYWAVQNGYSAALAKLLDCLDDKDWVDIRRFADRALRVMANHPDGVGYEPADPDSATWRKWWAAKK